MDIKGTSRFRGAKTSPSTDRFVGEYLHAPSQNPSPASSSAGDELSEDDIFSAGEFSGDANNPYSQPSTPSSSSSSTPRRLQGRQNHRSAFGQLDNFGILAALPENGTHRVLKHKTSVPSSSFMSSTSRPVPTIPKPPGTTLYSVAKYHQSAPVNVPVMPRSAMARTLQMELDEVEDNSDEATDEDGQMLPPHEIVARSLAKSPILSCSVLEGAGRTLKGRDQRQVRNAVWRQTGQVAEPMPDASYLLYDLKHMRSKSISFSANVGSPFLYYIGSNKWKSFWGIYGATLMDGKILFSMLAAYFAVIVLIPYRLVDNKFSSSSEMNGADEIFIGYLLTVVKNIGILINIALMALLIASNK